MLACDYFSFSMLAHNHDSTTRGRNVQHYFFNTIFCAIGVVPVKNVLKSLTHNSCDLKHNSLGPKGIHAVAKALIQNSFITELLIADNAIQTDGSAYVAKLLLENYNITKVDISENEIGSAGAERIARVIKENNSIQCFIISENLLNDRGAVFLAEAVKRNNGLRHLDLRDNKFSEEAGFHFGKPYTL